MACKFTGKRFVQCSSYLLFLEARSRIILFFACVSSPQKKQMTGKIFVDFCSIGSIARQLCNCVYFCKTKLLNLRTQTNQLVIYIGTVLGNMSNLSEPKRGVVPAAASIPLKKTKTARKKERGGRGVSAEFFLIRSKWFVQ